MKRGLWIVIAAGIVLILVGVVVILLIVPLGPALSFFRTENTGLASDALIASTSEGDTPLVEDSVGNPASIGCRRGTMTFLGLGESLPPGGVDGIRLVKVDFDNQKINILAIPASLWLATPELASSGTGGSTISEAYALAKSLAAGEERTRTLTAVNQVANTLATNFGYMPQHYFLVRFAAFTSFVDALGGIDLNLPAPLDGTTDGMGYFPAGAQHLTGAQAFELVRIVGAGEWDRFNRQEIVVTALYQALMKPENWDRLPELLEAFKDNILTDLSASQILEISCILAQPGLEVNQVQVPTGMIVFDGTRMLPSTELGAFILQTAGE